MTERRSTLPTTHPACQACVRWISESWPDLMKPVYSSSLDRFVSPVTICSCTDTSAPTPRSPERTDWIEAGSMTLTSSTGTPIHLYPPHKPWVRIRREDLVMWESLNSDDRGMSEVKEVVVVGDDGESLIIEECE